MTTLPTRGDPRRDELGRSHRAPAWSGDPATLTADELDDRIEALGAHIGRLSTEWTGDGWRPRPDFAAQAEPWVRQRLACLAELDRKRDGDE